MSRFRVAAEIDEAELVRRCLAYVTDPRPDRKRHHAPLFGLVSRLGSPGLGFPEALLDVLILEGGGCSEDIVDLASAWYGHLTPPVALRGSSPRPDCATALRGIESDGDGAARLPASTVTPREADVLRLVAAGQTNGQIARQLHVSPHTIKRHVGRILLKLGLPSRAAAAAFAVHAGLA